MKTRSMFSVLSVAAVLGVTAAISLGLSPQAASPATKAPAQATGGDTYTIDAVHSSVMFRISHMGVSNFYGRFNDISGTYTLDSSNPENSKFDVQVKTDSVDTNNAGRDKHLKTADFFNAPEFPAISFKSTKAVKNGDKLSVTGDLTMHGVTKPVTADLEIFPGKQTQQGFKSGFDATFVIKRTDFKMDKYVTEGALGDDVVVRVGAEGAKPK